MHAYINMHAYMHNADLHTSDRCICISDPVFVGFRSGLVGSGSARLVGTYPSLHGGRDGCGDAWTQSLQQHQTRPGGRGFEGLDRLEIPMIRRCSND